LNYSPNVLSKKHLTKLGYAQLLVFLENTFSSKMETYLCRILKSEQWIFFIALKANQANLI